MTPCRTALAALLLLTPTALSGQYRGARSGDYLFAADAWGARALWVNPAGLGTVNEASIMGEAMIERNAEGDYPLAQFGFGFNSRGFGFGFRRDRFGAIGSGNVWRLGFGRAAQNLALGAALSVYSGEETTEDVDIGLRWRAAPALELGLVAEHIGQPTVRDSTLRFGGRLGAAWSPLGGLVHLAVEGAALDEAADGWLVAYRAGIRLATPGRQPITFHAVLDFNEDFDVTRLVAGLAVGGAYQGVLMGGGARRDGTARVETLSLTGLATHRFP